MVDSRHDRKRKQRKKRRWLKRILFILTIIFLAIVGYGVYVYYNAMQAINESQVDLKRQGNKSEFREKAVDTAQDPISILLLGVETYSTNGRDGRADTEILVTMDPKKKKMTMVTIPRDSRVNIEHAGEWTGVHKINSAYTYGSLTHYGEDKLQIETVEKLLNVPIDKFVSVGFDGFRDIVDTLGGVDIDIKKGFWERNIYDNDKKIYFKAGQAHLDGEEALAFVRMRKRAVNVSYSREERQRQFLKAAGGQVLSAGSLFKVGEISDILGKHVDTNLNAKEIYDLEKQFSSMKESSITTLTIDGQNQRIGKTDYFIPEMKSLQDVSDRLRESLGLDPAADFETNADIPE
ncbi:LCP family protein [Falsibacillus albus]|uniref:LytR family transcriptional regulator n=1 Tax=Falsibacillus albus TaxID=2478915 RepID=A0A3L7JU09_9BACI|nr:LCP family protein [Falsibacillus albus]RLQ93579.1 LytR family transcriptional regulator [Falsibacillus albus]